MATITTEIDKQYKMDTLGLNQNGVIENSNRPQNLSEVQSFYNKKSVLITGATGFLGKVLTEKLLRSCPGLENLYLLVRPKRGKDVYSRLEEIFEDPFFDRLKEEVPKFRHKIVVISGDCTAAGLGLTIHDRQTIIEKVNIIFNAAATVKFDEELRTALATNVRASILLLEMAKDIKDLKAFMHISTAFSMPFLNRIEEKLYPCDLDYFHLQETIDKLSDDQVDSLLPKILGKWPNTYTFTKALTEKELTSRSDNVPLCIFRPAIVTSTAREPVKCWIDNLNGPTGVAVGAVTGVLRILRCNDALKADLVPVDYVVNCLLVASLNVNKEYSKSERPIECPVFNYVSSVENKLTWKVFNDTNFAMIPEVPFSNAIWHSTLILTSNIFLYHLLSFLLHFVPALLMDALSICIGKKPKMLKVTFKIQKFSSVIEYFSLREYVFCNRRTRELWKETSKEDKELFPFSMKNIDWNDYFKDYLLGIRRYFFKESDDTLPEARAKWRRLYYLHQTVKLVLSSFVFYCLWVLITRVL